MFIVDMKSFRWLSGSNNAIFKQTVGICEEGSQAGDSAWYISRLVGINPIVWGNSLASTSQRRGHMKRWFAIVAAVACLALPVVGSASEETVIPPEANWSPTPPTPAHLVVSQERVASTPKQASDNSWSSTTQASDEDSKYQAVNATTQDD
jgi:hypothetical protein